MKSTRWGFRWAVLFLLLVIVVLMSSGAIVRNIYLGHFGVHYGMYFDLLSTIFSMGLIVLTVFLMKRLKSLTWMESLQFLGYKKPNPRQILIGLLSLVPVVLAYFFVYRSGWIIFGHFSSLNIIQTIIVAGFFEETFYRGFLFQLLRPGRSFISAATLSGILWSISHVAQYTVGSEFHLGGVLASMVTALMFSIPAAFLFERGGNVIWGWMLSHVGFDIIIEAFTFNPNHTYIGLGQEMNTYRYSAEILLALFTWGLTSWLLPQSKKIAIPLNAKTKAQIRHANKICSQWSPALIKSILAVTVFLVLCPAIKDALEKSEIDEYRLKAEAHPDQASAHELLGFEYQKYSQPNLAIPEFQKAIELDPKNSLSYVAWGQCLNNWKDYGQAAQKFEKAVEISPDSYEAFLGWGKSLEDLGKYDEAVEKFEKVIQLANTDEIAVAEARHEIEIIHRNHH